MLDECRLGIYSDLKKSFKMFKTKQYLCVCLEKKLLSCFDDLNPVCVLVHLINCDRKIRFVNKCKLCTRFYVYSKSTMTLLRSTTMISTYLTHDDNVNELFQDDEKTMAYLNIFCKANDFIQHWPERVNFGESFKELVDKPFASYILYFEILIRI